MFSVSAEADIFAFREATWKADVPVGEVGNEQKNVWMFAAG